MPANTNNPLAYTLGMEFETECILPNGVPTFIRELGFNPTHDSSIESHYTVVNGVATTGPNILHLHRESSRQVVGVELVSVPINLETTDPINILHPLTKWLTEQGETAQSFRAGIHLHIGLSQYNLATLLNMVQWGRALEALFFRLGGNGYQFRGEQNDAAFCRPITKNGPPCVPRRGGYSQCFDVEDLLKSKSTTEFWGRYGNSRTGDVPRYVPQRYTWLNFYSLLAHGTLEVRVFNKTLNPWYIRAEMELWHRFVLACLGTAKCPFPEMSVYSQPTEKELIALLDRLKVLWEISPRSYSTLKQIIQLTPAVSLNPGHILSHLTETSSVGNPWEGDSTYATKLITDDVRRARVITIHNIDSGSRDTGIDRIMRSVRSLSDMRSNPDTGEVVPEEPEEEPDTDDYSDDDDSDEEEPN